ncbi:hypothetical protein SASPL_148489 [Salvia splendens]|uniref:Polygalacturonase n=1 Tax=Salvia splendens TaxID=180675 RepID=A0A8X8WAS1_SALSN|nr:polygalacturonase-like [Salvia splendens]KAG6390744.1 hypothetical protein SASPL_148489 [Salvia splendens]
MPKLSHTIVLALIATLHTCNAAFYNVVNFGAKGDGVTDSSSAFLKAWAAACSSVEQSTIYVPKGTFLVNSIVFSGACKSKMQLRIYGALVAPYDYKSFLSDQAWITFEYVNGVSVVGGDIDARGSSYWACKKSGANCPFGARSFSFQTCNDVEINGLTSHNSHAVHVFINGCNNMRIQDLTIVAPGDSPNTDGIHIGNSNNISVRHANIATGDDCISIGPGTSQMYMDNIVCGPGHGISIGSMGGNPGEGGVEHIVVNNSIFTRTENGVRIKTWAKPFNGYARDIMFENLQMQNVSNPIIIDQEYCPERNCPNGNSGVKLSDVSFYNITGTSWTQDALVLICSWTKPCERIYLQDIHLNYINALPIKQHAASHCENAGVISNGVVIPNC